MDAGLTVNLSKCEFGQASVDYLGRVVEMERTEAFPVPTNPTELQRYLAAVGG